MTELDTARLPGAVSASPGGDWRPADTFADRLSRVRRHMGWNAAEASTECGFGRQNWRKWEVEGTRPSDMAQVVEKIHTRTGVDRNWLMWGDSVSAENTRQYFDTYASFGCMEDEQHPPVTLGLIPAA
jgi:hypothetical protein